MRSKLRIVLLGSLVALGGLLAVNPREAQAQLVISTPGFGLGVGAYPAYGGLYPGYGAVAPIAPAVVPVPVRPYPYGYGYGRPFYGPRPYYGGYRPGFYR